MILDIQVAVFYSYNRVVAFDAAQDGDTVVEAYFDVGPPVIDIDLTVISVDVESYVIRSIDRVCIFLYIKNVKPDYSGVFFRLLKPLLSYSFSGRSP